MGSRFSANPQAGAGAGTGHHMVVNDFMLFPTTRHPNSGGIVYRKYGEDAWHIVEGDPLSARVTCRRACVLERGVWRARVEANAIGSWSSTGAR